MKTTQKEQVLEYMRTRGSITTFIAFDEFAICRLSERIRELERDGHLINHTPITRDGKSYVAYSLVEGEQNERDDSAQPLVLGHDQRVERAA